LAPPPSHSEASVGATLCGCPHQGRHIDLPITSFGVTALSVIPNIMAEKDG